MHKQSLISFLMALTMVSCISKTNLVQGPIVFNPVIGHEVRSSDMSVPFPEDKSFGVWATDDNTSTEYISDSEVRCSDNVWTSGALPLWPANSTLTFYAYSPCHLPVEFEGGTMKLNDFNIETDGDELLFAQTASGLSSTQGDVKLPFTHALTRLDMRIASGFGTDVQVRIDRIVLKNVATAGDYDSSDSPCWRADESTATDIVFFDSERDGQFLAGAKMQFIGGVHTVIPQQSDTSIELNYSFRVEDGDWIGGQSDSTERIYIEWEQGRHYTYSLTINERKLSYTTGIGHWSERL